ncbi:flavo protein NADH-dependent oxidoreductase [Aspergillus sclerotiicarbonarius CBS 121057]|uniref:Flavo protein NADH-dependent oxidoreductase n=1 Tax=Aspergillus sclerotiicarbonarius (strain CBS 121057 / IBT 28362) TaxID=1448318 RepID=A0A319FBL4_ASPSB|nr:flavo protein NADH-dependent oxidoreductase [Aspergillus sclerotiicarbonarius CBS 121057]
MAELLEPIILGDGIPLRNRICMGSMTRNRCMDDNKPVEATIKHYTDRARDGTGLIVAEGTFICAHGAEWPNAPVMYNQEHADAWARVTSAVHEVGGKILFQPWHAGRIQNDNMPMLKQSGYPVYAPSKIPAKGGKFRTLEGNPGHTHNLTEIDDPKAIVEQFRRSVTLAKRAGFDGIELLSQGGYLLHNFLCSHSNTRTDQYGGSVENRCRFPLEVLDAIIEVWGPRAVGIKICPSDDYNDTTISYEELTDTYTYYIKELMRRDLAFINLSRRGCDVGRETDSYFRSQPRPEGKELPPKYEPLAQFGSFIKYPGSRTMLMVNHEYTVEEAADSVRKEKIDLVTFARPFIYNPVSG